MPTFVYDRERGVMVDKATGEPMNTKPPEGGFPCPRIIQDIPAYQSPIDGRYISGRKAKRDDLARHNCVDAAELKTATGGKFRNKKFAEKWGMTSRLAEDAK